MKEDAKHYVREVSADTGGGSVSYRGMENDRTIVFWCGNGVITHKTTIFETKKKYCVEIKENITCRDCRWKLLLKQKR